MFVSPVQGHLHYFVTCRGVPIRGCSEGNTSTPKACVERKHTIQQSTSMGEWFLCVGEGNGICFGPTMQDFRYFLVGEMGCGLALEDT